MDPQVILIVFLPILVFEAALFTDASGLRAAQRPILALAAPGVLLSLLSTAAVATWVLQLPFAASLLLGALLSITDTVSVLLAFRSVRVPHRLAAIMEGESLFNDGTALVLVAVATEVLSQGHFDAGQAARALLVAIFGGVALGAAFGALGALVLRHTPDNLTARVRGSESMYVQVDAMGADAEGTLSSIPGVTRVSPSDKRDGIVGFEVESEAGRDVRRHLASTVVGQGWGLLELRPMRMSLEEIFLQIITTEEAAAAPETAAEASHE